MSIKKKLGLGLASAALGISLIGGGTYAYFSDTAVSSPNTFAAGTLDLAVNPEVMFTINNMKPGDKMLRQFTLSNSGSLAIDKVTLNTEVFNETGSDDLKNHLVVKFIENEGQLPPGENFDQWDDQTGYQVITEKTLAELEGITAEDLAEELGMGQDGISPNGGKDYLTAMIVFEDDGDQNHLQGASLSFKWTFTGTQGAGIWK